MLLTKRDLNHKQAVNDRSQLTKLQVEQICLEKSCCAGWHDNMNNNFVCNHSARWKVLKDSDRRCMRSNSTVSGTL